MVRYQKFWKLINIKSQYERVFMVRSIGIYIKEKHDNNICKTDYNNMHVSTEDQFFTLVVNCILRFSAAIFDEVETETMRIIYFEI